MLVGLTVVIIISLCVCVSNHHALHLKYIQILFLNKKNDKKRRKKFEFFSKSKGRLSERFLKDFKTTDTF